MSSHGSRVQLSPGRSITFVLLGVLLLVAVGLALIGSGLVLNWDTGRMPQEALSIDQRMIRIADRLQCPICEGQSVAFSNSKLAAEMRRKITETLEAGDSEAQIMDYFVERYGPKILREPPRDGLNAWLWITPVVAFAAAAMWLGWTLWRMARAQPTAEELLDEAPELDDEVHDLLVQYDEELFA